ncbi:SDR family NAD(P)-dependent oxidoreductase [Flavobacteriales bacterium]|jgi:3-oxoacyl-[acyl-carrier protein] reductase|nr:SDR family NAD(P)-dependent oxidoreductase [bacterium]MDC3389776.1 SDR family NAD(P)-dependent oxidoreductase [Flavobacteriales bacterium]
MENVSGKKVLITGGSSGIGKATAKMLIQHGAIVSITGRDKEKLENVASEINAIPIHLDVSKYNSIAVKVLDAFHSMKGIDVLINNAGIGEFAKLEDVKISQFEKIFSTNVFGLTMLTQEVAKFFKTQQHGSIINIGSSAATAGFPSGSVYCASKFALRGLTECWRHELRRENIRVMLINPSEVTTAFNNKKRLERDNEPKKLTPDEIAHAIVSAIRMDDRGFIPELNVWATNPF